MSTDALQASLQREAGRSAQQATGERSRKGARIATGAALALAGWVVASWYWDLTTDPAAHTPSARQPAPDRRVPASQLAERIIAAAPFGQTAESEPVLTAGPTGDVRLKGVIARSGTRPGGAIVSQGGADSYVATGGEIAPGLMLLEVHPDHAILRRNGRAERVELEERSARMATPGLGARVGTPPPAAGTSMPAPGNLPGLPPGMGMPPGMPSGMPSGAQQIIRPGQSPQMAAPAPETSTGALPPAAPGAPGPVPRRVPGRSSTSPPTGMAETSVRFALDAQQAPESPRIPATGLATLA